MNSRLTAAALFAFAILLESVGAQTSVNVEQRDTVCGPRCVAAVLAHFGQEVSLIDLVREMQFPDINAGCSLEDIQEVLARRSIHTYAIRASATPRVTWPHLRRKTLQATY